MVQEWSGGYLSCPKRMYGMHINGQQGAFTHQMPMHNWIGWSVDSRTGRHCGMAADGTSVAAVVSHSFLTTN